MMRKHIAEQAETACIASRSSPPPAVAEKSRPAQNAVGTTEEVIWEAD